MTTKTFRKEKVMHHSLFQFDLLPHNFVKLCMHNKLQNKQSVYIICLNMKV